MTKRQICLNCNFENTIQWAMLIFTFKKYKFSTFAKIKEVKINLLHVCNCLTRGLDKEEY